LPTLPHGEHGIATDALGAGEPSSAHDAFACGPDGKHKIAAEAYPPSSYKRKVEAAGIELGPQSSGNSGVGGQSGAKCGALDAPKAPLDPDLAAVVDAWPALPPTIKAGILAMIGAAEITGG
jgi:hypothetical protein